MKKIIFSFFLVIVSLICSCNSASGSSANNESSSKINSNMINSSSIINHKIIEKEAISMVEFCNRSQFYDIENAGTDGLSLKLHVKNEDAIFEVRSDSSYLYVNGKATQNNDRLIYVKNDEIIIWKMGVHLPVIYLGYIDIIARIGTNIVGYATIYLEPNNVKQSSCQSVTGHLLDAKIFPKQNGNYQNVTLDYVKNKIYCIKESILSLPLGNYEGEVDKKEIIENHVDGAINVDNRVFYLDNEKNPSYKNYEGINYLFKSLNNKVKFKCFIDGVGSFSKDEVLEILKNKEK